MNRANNLKSYREQISKSIEKSFAGNHNMISISDLVPGVAFREIWPLELGFWTPLRSYRRNKITNHDFVPRKFEPETAIWLLECMIGDDCEYEQPNLNVICIGDSGSDLELAKNLATERTPFNWEGDNSPKISLYLYDPEEKWKDASEGNLSVFSCHSWQEIRLLGGEAIKATWRLDSNFLLLDVDRTTLLPRGVCDKAFDRLGHDAFYLFIKLFLLESQTIPVIQADNAFNTAKTFPPYVYGRLAGDEDIRALGALLLCSGLIEESEFEEKETPVELLDWVEKGIKRLSFREDEKEWNQCLLMRELEDVRIAVIRHDCSIEPSYREQEEKVMLTMATQNQCPINSEIVELVKLALKHEVTPIAYSDRPGLSMGLTLRSYFRSRPRVNQRSIIEMPLTLV